MPRKPKTTPESGPFVAAVPAKRKAAAPKERKAKDPSPAEAVAAIFSRDPQSLTPSDFRAVIAASRAARARWELKESAARRKKEGGGDEDQEAE